MSLEKFDASYSVGKHYNLDDQDKTNGVGTFEDDPLKKKYDAMETGEIDLNDLAPRIHELTSRQPKLRIRMTEIESFLADRRVELASPKVVTHYVNEGQQLPRTLAGVCCPLTVSCIFNSAIRRKGG